MNILKANLQPLVHTATLLGMIGANIAASLWQPELCLLTVPIAAVAMCCALSVVHECAHRTYFTPRAANGIVGRAWALLILMNFSAYKREHMMHHRHLGTIRDPEPQIILKSRACLVRALALNPHIWSGWKASLKSAFSVEGAENNLRSDAQRLVAMKMILIAAFTIWPSQLTIGFLIPYILSTILDNLVSLPEHARLARSSAMPITRSLQAPPLLSHLLYSVNRHVEHHTSPGVTAHKLAPEAGGVEKLSYWVFYRRCWDALALRSSNDLPRHSY